MDGRARDAERQRLFDTCQIADVQPAARIRDQWQCAALVFIVGVIWLAFRLALYVVFGIPPTTIA